MRRISIICVMGLLFSVILLFAAAEKPYDCSVVEANDRYMIVEVAFDSVLIYQSKTNAGWVTEFYMRGCSFTDKENLPKLPTTAMMLGIPPQGQVRLKVLHEETVTKAVGIVALVEWPPYEPRTGLESLVQVTQDVYPQQTVELGIEGFLRDQRVLQIGLYPVKYYPTRGIAQITRRLQLRLDFDRQSDAPSTGLFRSSAFTSTDKGFDDLLSATLINDPQCRMWRATVAPQMTLSKQTASGTRVRIGVEGDGLYAVSGRELQAAGVNLSSINPAALALNNRGKTVPILVEGGGDGRFDEEDRIIFIGQHNAGENSYFSPYSDTNIYWLEWSESAGARFATVSGTVDHTIADTVSSASMFFHLEYESPKFERFLSIAEDEIDPWYWRELVNESEYSVTLPIANARSDRPMRIRAGFRGSTYLPVAPDHHLKFYFNEQALGSLLWDNQNAAVFDSEARLLPIRKDENIFKMVLPMDLPGVNVDRVLFDWLEIEYTGDLTAHNDSLRFIIPSLSGANIRIEGFTSDKIYLLTEEGQHISNPFIKRKGDRYFCLFHFKSTVPVHFYAVAGNRLKRVTSLEVDDPSNLRDRSNGADYIIITHRDFYVQARQLADFRNRQGWRTAVIDIQDIYDEFNDGIFDPRAIRAFLQYAYLHWAPSAPLYVLLFGDTTHNMNKRFARTLGTPSFVPAMMVFTGSFGATSSDNALVAVNGNDILPDMYIGRLPANNAKEAQILLQKVLDYEQKPIVGEWRRNLALVYANGSQFENDAEELYQKYIPKRFITNRLSTNPLSRYFGSTETMAEMINTGQTLLNFIGHGGGGVYFDDQLFLTEDVKRLNNKDKYPIIFSLTCFVGHFDDDEKESLSEALLRAENKGIVAHFGSVARASLLGDHYLNKALFKVLFDQGVRRIGQVTTMAKILLISMTNGYWDTLKHFVLLGDPATNLYLAEPNIQLQLAETDFTSGNTISVTGSCSAFGNGTVRLGVYNQIDSLIAEKQMIFQGGTFQNALYTFDSQNIQLWPPGRGKGFVRAYADNGSQDACAVAEFTVNANGSAQVLLDPASPKHQDEVFFIVQFNEDQFQRKGGIHSVYVLWSYNKNNFTRVNCSRQSKGVWRSDLGLKNSEGTRIFYKLIIMSNDGSQYIDDVREYSVGYRPDLLADPLAVRIFGSLNTQIRFKVMNNGDMDSGPFRIKITEGASASTYKQIGDILPVSNVPPRSEVTVETVWSGQAAGERRLWFNLDVDNQVNESNEGNNTTTFSVKIVTPLHGSGGPVFSAEGNYYIEIPGESASTVSPFSLVQEWRDLHQKAATLSGLTPLSLKSATQPFLYRISFVDTTLTLKKSIQVAILYDKADVQIQELIAENKVRLYGWNDQSATWNGLTSTVDKSQGIISAQLPPPLQAFALMVGEDSQPPLIRISVAGQNFVDGDVIPAKPIITAFMEDASGFDIAGNHVKLLLDGVEVGMESIQLYQSDNSRRTLTLTYAPVLQPGAHELTLLVKDINGNLASERITFQVTGEFAIDFLANHPNPFASQTIIAFYLTEMASEVKLAVHTTSGRLIKKFVLTDISGYNEVDWDGTDDDGNPVANGVYYLRFTAKRGENTIERIEKMARLQ